MTSNYRSCKWRHRGAAFVCAALHASGWMLLHGGRVMITSGELLISAAKSMSAAVPR